MKITTYHRTTEENRKLQFVASYIALQTGVQIEVENTYFDFGQDWAWTTLIAYRSATDHYQMLSPRDYDRIGDAVSVEELMEIADDIIVDQHDLLKR